jgi:membrane protein required for colicin V production
MAPGVLLDLVALGLLALCALLGAWRGAWASASSLAAVVGGYAAAVAGALALGPAATAALGVPPLLGGAAAGTGAFLVAALTIGLAGRALRRAADERRGDAPRSPADRALGALFGASRGAVLVLLLGVAGLWLDAARELAGPDTVRVPALDTPLRAATRATLARVAEAAVDQEGTGSELAVRVATRPAETLAALRRVAEHPALAALADDPGFWSEIEAGRAEIALARPSFLALARDPAVRSDLALAGAVDPAAAADPARFRAAVRPVLVELGPRLAHLRNDPELQRLAADPSLSDAIARRDVVALLAHPGLQRVMARALAPAAPPG